MLGGMRKGEAERKEGREETKEGRRGKKGEGCKGGRMSVYNSSFV